MATVAPNQLAAPLPRDKVALLEPFKCSQWLDKCIEAETPEGKVRNDPDVKSAIREILARAEYDTKFFGQCFMAESYDGPMTYQHDETWKEWDDETMPRTGICAWRGFGKSLGSQTKAVKSICFRQQPFIIVIGKTYDYASGETEAIKQELLQNERIIFVFGRMQAKAYEGLDTKFSEKAWFASDPKTGKPISFICPKGARQQIRGSSIRINRRKQRPTLIIIDDLEDDKYLNSEEYRKEVWDWLNGAVLKCTDARSVPNARTGRWDRDKNDPSWKPPWRIFYQDTFKHEDSAMAHILESTEWTTRRYSKAAFKKTEVKGKEVTKWWSLVPEIISDEQIQAEVAAAEHDGQMDRFAMESMCLPVNPEFAAWTRSGYQYYSEDEMNIQYSTDYDRFIVVDPAKTSTERSDYTAILAVAANIKTGKIFFRKQIVARLEPEERLDMTIQLALDTNSKLMAIEFAGIDEILEHQYRNELSRRGLNMNIIKLQARAKPQGDYGSGREAIKRARAGFIIPYYRKGYIYHEHSLHDGPLESQQLSYPKPARWDALDCAGYVPQVLLTMGRYFAFADVEGQEREEFPGASNTRKKTSRKIKSRQWALN